MVGATGIEPVTPSMSRKCSTAELSARDARSVGSRGYRQSPTRAQWRCSMPSLDIALRPARLDDLDAILAIERGEGYENLVGRSTRGEHEDMLAGPRHAYFVGEREGVEAFAILRDLDHPHGNLYLKRIAVARPGQGDGARFLSLLIDWTFANTKAHLFRLDCFDDNFRAQAMYRKLGFRRDGLLREAYLGPDGRRRDLALMSLLRPEWSHQRRDSTISSP
jgi:diamine N-acetyltransferase